MEYTTQMKVGAILALMTERGESECYIKNGDAEVMQKRILSQRTHCDKYAASAEQAFRGCIIRLHASRAEATAYLQYQRRAWREAETERRRCEAVDRRRDFRDQKNRKRG